MTNSMRSVTYDAAVQVISSMIEANHYEKIDLGHSFIYRGTHPKLGEIVVFSSAEGMSAIVTI